MKNLIKAYQNVILKEINKPSFQHLKISFENKLVKFKNVITEMNSNIYPIPNEVLSHFIKKVFDNGFEYVSNYSIKTIINLIEQSQNIDKVKFDIGKLKLAQNKSLLFICLPYQLNIWLEELHAYFENEEIKNIFSTFNNAHGVQGTYVNGYLIIINSDKLHELKDIEEVVEHEFIHLFEDIDNAETEELSFDLLTILQHPSEFKTFKVNLLNRLDKLSNKYLLKNPHNTVNDFLNELFERAESSNLFDNFFNSIKDLDTSNLLEDNMYFFWYMVKAKPKEFNKWKSEIYEHFS